MRFGESSGVLISKRAGRRVRVEGRVNVGACGVSIYLVVFYLVLFLVACFSFLSGKFGRMGRSFRAPLVSESGVFYGKTASVSFLFRSYFFSIFFFTFGDVMCARVRM